MKNRLSALLAALFLSLSSAAQACTGLSLTAADGSVVVGRTVEWALSDAQHYRIALFPRTRKYAALTPDGPNGMQWQGRYGFVSMTAYGQDYGPDGMNEAGLYVGMYYLPGFAEYAKYDRKQAHRSLSVGDFMQWMLSSFKTVDEVLAHLDSVQVINVDDPRFGGAAQPFHWKISDPDGKSVVLELVEGGKIKIYDAFLGVITNAPTYDWHLTNLRNYLHLSGNPRASIQLDSLDLTPLGAGSSLLGLPGDFTPPSRFIRAAALVAGARPLSDATDASFEAFRMLDSFNIPLGATVRRDAMPKDIPGATQITTVSDLRNRVYYFHTMFNRQVRKIDLKRIDFGSIRQQILDDDTDRHNQVRDITPAN
ncbi:MAG: choloylglycine hydrolase family protein [Azonexus sp.]|nr:choloylglycine hydrolase family protein [Azonexus sp.]